MANILDYLDWRGDLTLAQAPFNEVDNLILAELSFVDFRDVVPAVGGGSLPLSDAADAVCDYIGRDTVPERLASVQVQLAVIAYNKRGAEGESSRSENA